MIKDLFTLSIFVIISSSLFAQTRTIKGNVEDENGKPSGNINVTVKENKKEIAQTDKDGNFSIKVNEPGKISLVFSASGFETKTVLVTSDVVLNVKLK